MSLPPRAFGSVTTTKTVKLTADELRELLMSHFDMHNSNVRFELAAEDNDSPGCPTYYVQSVTLTREQKDEPRGSYTGTRG